MRTRSAGANVECASDVMRIHHYYFPIGTKVIPYSSIRGVRRVTLGPFRGRARLWGTANPRYWANLDLARTTKKTGLILDVGGVVRPFITPKDPNAVLAAIAEHGGPTPGAPSRSPVI